MTPHQRDVLRSLANRGAQTPASLAVATSLSTVGTTRALQALRELGCVESETGGYWHLTIIGVDCLKADRVLS